MKRTFLHEFFPAADSPVTGPNVVLTVQEIEDAGLREVLQTPGAPFSSWTILDALLEPTGDGSPFVFSAPLGAAREVKVALSGLFGRFVARAYLERYFHLHIFAHVREPTMVLDDKRSIHIVRLERGDLPDWIACASAFSNLTVAEAKGSHDPSGPSEALERAWKQAGRIDVRQGGHGVTLKRLAIVTRWGMTTGGPAVPWISVRDPLDRRQPISSDGEDAIFVGVFRHHVANILAPLGHGELAGALRALATAGSASDQDYEHDIRRVGGLIDETEKVSWEDRSDTEDLIGGIVTRAGPLLYAGVSPTDREVLARLDLRPIVVGMERDVVHAAAVGDPSTIRRTLSELPAVERLNRRGSRASGWIIPLG